ncbi:hypothetical protein VNO80_01878 [Phaseolus coccineus]|uniref:Transmembrane protein n=1 Tax=Phaseolus coccineus TaxID=3886 RepID=A0AAN9RT77_PHACN
MASFFFVYYRFFSKNGEFYPIVGKWASVTTRMQSLYKSNSFKFFKRVDDVEEDVEEECGDETKQELEVTRKEVCNMQKKLIPERRTALILHCVVGLCWAIIFLCGVCMLNKVRNSIMQ